METSSILTDPRYRNSTFATDPYLGRRPRGFRPGVQPAANIGTLADALAAQQLQAQQAPAAPASGPGAQLPAPVNVNNPAAVAYLAQQAQSTAVNTKAFNRQIAPNLPSALLPDEVNASRYAYLNQLASAAAGGPSVQTNDMLAAAPMLTTAANGRRTLSQNPASLMAAANGLTPQAWNQQRTTELANRYAESQTPQPRASTLSFEGGTKINILTDANGNTRVIEPPKENAPDTTQLAKLIAERDAAVQAGRFDVAQAYDDTIKNYVAKGGKEAPMDPAAFAAALGGMMGAKPTAGAPPPAAPAAASAPITTYRMPAQPDANAQAAAWARANPTDPRSAKILARLGLTQ
jgi:hypothetical protein